MNQSRHKLLCGVETVKSIVGQSKNLVIIGERFSNGMVAARLNLFGNTGKGGSRMNILYIIAGCAVVSIIWTASIPKSKSIQSEISYAEPIFTFQDRWGKEVILSPVLEPRIVKTIRIPVNPHDTNPAPVAEIELPESKIKRPKRKVIQSPTDVCKKHRMRKVYTRNKKSWRCRK